MSNPAPMLSSQNCDIYFDHPDGKFVFDALDLDVLLYKAQKIKADPDDPSWIMEFRKLIKETYNVQITGRDALNLVDAINQVLDNLKKTDETTPSSPPTTE